MNELTIGTRALGFLRTAIGRSRLRANRASRVAYVGAAHALNLGDRIVFDAARVLFEGVLVVPVEGAARERRLARIGLSGPRVFPAGVLGGGTLINDYSREVVSAMLDIGVPMTALGTGAGSGGWDQPPDLDLAAWKPILARFQRVGVRGPRSRAALEAIGVSGVEVVGDLALACVREGSSDARPRRLMLNMIEKAPREQWNPAVLDALVALVRRCAREGWEIAPFAMHPHDLRALDEFLRRVGVAARAPWLAREPSEVIDAMERTGLVVSMRLHGAVLAVCGRAPAVSLGYREKCVDFMESVGLEDALLALDAEGDAGELTLALERRVTAALDLRAIAHHRACEHRARLEAMAATVRESLPR